MISTVIFDFGGVLAEEGFRNGLLRIATKWKYDAKWFRHTAVEIIYSCGYVNGLCKEEIFWKLLKQNTGHCLGDSILREFLIGGFVLRPKVIQFVKRIRDLGFIVLLLSDHTNWLDELDEKEPFFHLFHNVYNSYHVHKNKRDGTIFPYVLSDMEIKAKEVLLIDDNIGNVNRAKEVGLNVVHFTGIDLVIENVESLLSKKSKIKIVSPWAAGN